MIFVFLQIFWVFTKNWKVNNIIYCIVLFLSCRHISYTTSFSTGCVCVCRWCHEGKALAMSGIVMCCIYTGNTLHTIISQLAIMHCLPICV